MLKVEWNENKAVRMVDGGFIQQAALPLLRGRKIHFKNPQRRKWISKRKSVEPGPQNHILAHAFRDCGRKAVFGIAAARGHKQAKVARHRMHGPFHIARKLGADQPHRYRIVKDARQVDRLVGSAANRNPKSCPAGAPWLHD